MEFIEEELQNFRDNQKTQFLAGQFDELTNKQINTQKLAQEVPEMSELAEEEVKDLEQQRIALYEEMRRILLANKEEEERP